MEVAKFAEKQFAEHGISAIVLSLPGQGFLNHGPISEVVRNRMEADACITTVVTVLGFNDFRFSRNDLSIELARLHDLCPDIVMTRPDDGWNSDRFKGGSLVRVSKRSISMRSTIGPFASFGTIRN